MQGWSLSEAKHRCEVTEIRPLLEQGQLVGYARPVGLQDILAAIPPLAWPELEMVDENGSCLIHLPSKTEFVDLKIFPILHAPDAPELLNDRMLAEVFIDTVIRDPEAAAVGRTLWQQTTISISLRAGMHPVGTWIRTGV